VGFQKIQARRVVIFFLEYQKIANQPDFERTCVGKTLFCNYPRLPQFNRTAPVLTWRFSFGLQSIPITTDDSLLAG
jgi:hypothetical protein